MRHAGIANVAWGLVLAGCAGSQQAVKVPLPEVPQPTVVEEARAPQRAHVEMVAERAKTRFCPVWGEPYPEDKVFCLIHGAPLRPEAPSARTAFAQAEE